MGKSLAPFGKYLPRQIVRAVGIQEKNYLRLFFQFGAAWTGQNRDENQGTLHAFMQNSHNVA